MAVISKLLQSYAALLYPNGGKQEGRINLSCRDGYKLYLLFQDPSDPLTPNTYNSRIKAGVARQPFVQFRYYLDLVRNEKPIHVNFLVDETPPRFIVYCAGEEPGEGEM